MVNKNVSQENFLCWGKIFYFFPLLGNSYKTTSANTLNANVWSWKLRVDSYWIANWLAVCSILGNINKVTAVADPGFVMGWFQGILARVAPRKLGRPRPFPVINPPYFRPFHKAQAHWPQSALVSLRAVFLNLWNLYESYRKKIGGIYLR